MHLLHLGLYFSFTFSMNVDDMHQRSRLQNISHKGYQIDKTVAYRLHESTVCPPWSLLHTILCIFLMITGSVALNSTNNSKIIIFLLSFCQDIFLGNIWCRCQKWNLVAVILSCKNIRLSPATSFTPVSPYSFLFQLWIELIRSFILFRTLSVAFC